MPSNPAVRQYDQIIGIGILALFALGIVFGFVFQNWELLESWVPTAAIALIIYLIYRFVRAVEHIAYES